MSIQGKSLLDLKSLSAEQLLSFFDRARSLKETKMWRPHRFLAGLVFLESSTRTTGSFQVAVHRWGGQTVVVSGSTSSVTKGESVLDTCLTLQSFGSDLLIVRHGSDESLASIARQLKIPVINAGEGVAGHPTQGLLDAFTIQEARGGIRGERILVVGDTKHSRVASSALEVFTQLGAEVASSGPLVWKRDDLRYFDRLEQGLEWATVVMSLRVQKERHMGQDSSTTDLMLPYQLNSQTLRHFRSDGVILHPGPFNRGIELTDEVLLDARCCIWKQVENGVFIRAAVIAEILGLT